ncbi:MAG: DUF1015 domain-containing protein [Acidiferrobacterales bacterium]
MPLVRPFAALRPSPEHAHSVLAPPYDVLSTEEARVRAANNRWCFLHVSRPEIDLPAGTDPYAPAVYARGKDNFVHMIAQGILRRDREPGYYVYRLIMGAHAQTGLVVITSLAAYRDGRIRKHEHTQPSKEDDRTRHIRALNAQTGPVALTYRHCTAIDTLIQAASRGDPEIDVITSDDVRHCLWAMRDQTKIAALTTAMEEVDALYIADGHHRTAAAARIAAERRAGSSAGAGSDAHDYFLAVIFPDKQMQILDYNRVVRDLNGLTLSEFLGKLRERFAVTKADAPVRPANAGEIGMYLGGQWYALLTRSALHPRDAVARLGVTVLSETLLGPVLGVTDLRRDTRIEFVGGIRGLQELARRVDSGDMAVAFSLYPTSLADVMAIADAGRVMPPKSTWFEPKLADGLVSYPLD